MTLHMQIQTSGSANRTDWFRQLCCSESQCQHIVCVVIYGNELIDAFIASATMKVYECKLRLMAKTGHPLILYCIHIHINFVF